MLFVQRKTEESVTWKTKKFKDSQHWNRVFLVALFMINCIISIPDKSNWIFQGFLLLAISLKYFCFEFVFIPNIHFKQKIINNTSYHKKVVCQRRNKNETNGYIRHEILISIHVVLHISYSKSVLFYNIDRKKATENCGYIILKTLSVYAEAWSSAAINQCKCRG